MYAHLKDDTFSLFKKPLYKLNEYISSVYNYVWSSNVTYNVSIHIYI